MLGPPDIKLGFLTRVQYLFVGEEVQRLSVIHSLPQLLQQDEPQCMQRVIPKVQQVLPGASAEFHLAASSTFLTILEKKLVHPRTFTQTFLQSILSSIDSRDPVVSCAWLETLLDVIDLLPASIIKSDILPVAIAKGQISQPVSSRIMIKKEILPLIHSLCQDVSYEVRACICSQFHFFAKALDVEAVQPALLPILVELASDEESLVRLQAVETIVNMLPHLQPEILKYTVIPLVKKMCEQSLRAEDAVMVKIAEHFGRLCLGLDNYLMPQEKLWMLKHYQKMAQLGLPQLMKQTPDYQKDPAVFDIGRALLKCEAEISITNNWRLHAMMLGQLECLPHCMPSDFIHSHFVPVVFNRIHTAVLNSSHTTKENLEDQRKAEEEAKLLSGGLPSVVSKRKPAVEPKRQDQVANIRLKLVTLLPSLKMMIYLPTDRKLLTALETCIRKLLMHEKDRDVMSQLRMTIQALDNIEIKMDTAQIQGVHHQLLNEDYTHQAYLQ
ncbi:hypothetical protein C0J52_11141 [Blattella germanica]|nr:hypothetical protein C0J52_11141 [Blattella germanica]